jgi:multiple sugar transport system permease protein
VVITTSLKPASEIKLSNFALLPHEWRFQNFVTAMSDGTWGRYFFNSIFVTVVSVVGSLFFNSLAGYSFARLRFRGRQVLFVFFLIGIMVPPQSLLIPQFIIMHNMPLAGGNNLFGHGGTGFINTYWALILPQLSGSFGIFLCRQFYLSFPWALDDAGRIDGAGALKRYFSIFLPMSGPVLATLTVLKTVYVWNDFFFPLIMTNSNEMQTVQLALYNFRGQFGVQWELLMAATLLTIIPVMAVFLAMQRYFIQGIANQGIKG